MDSSVVIVTGGGRGIGRATCRRFAKAGDRVVAVSRSADELDETKRLIQAAGGTCHISVTDLCAADQIGSLVRETLNRLGRIDVLVNNAGLGPLVGIEELDPSLFDTLMAVNVNAIYSTCRAVWPVMVERGGGVIINLSSMASVDPFPGLGAYGAAKAWVNAWTRGLADEGRPHGIRVFSVAPGAVETRMLRDAFPDFPAEQTLSPEEVADWIHTLAQPACQYATGQTIFIKK